MKRSLEDRAREASDAARACLRSERRGDGSWGCTFDPNAFTSALYVLVRRAGRLDASAEADELEVGLARHVATQVGPDGGFYRHPHLAGRGPSTPLHTAAALSALLGAGVPADAPPLARAVSFLLDRRRPDGTWHDDQTTCTIFAGSMYYAYPFLSRVIPLEALASWTERVTPRPSSAGRRRATRAAATPASEPLRVA